MTTLVRQLAEAELLDRAAALLARRGFDKTSVQDVARAVGLSKAGLLHHYPSKDLLHAAVRAHAEALGEQVLAQVTALEPGPGRDRRALEALVDVALRHPGTVALLLADASDVPDATDGAASPDAGRCGVAVLRAFGLDVDAQHRPTGPDPERVVRVVGALGALAVLALAATRSGSAASWRPLVVATCLDALGRPSPRTDPDPLEP